MCAAPGSREKRDGLGNLLRPRRAAERRLREGLPTNLVRQSRRHRRIGEARLHHVDGDSARGELPGRRAREAEQAGLGRRVVRLSELPATPVDRRDDDDAPRRAPAERRRRGAQVVRRARQIHRDDAIPGLVAHLPEHAVATDPGGEDEQVEGLAPAQDVGDRPARRLRVGDVRRVQIRLAERAREAGEAPRVSVDDRDARSPGLQPDGAGEADAARAAGHERDPTGELATGAHPSLPPHAPQCAKVAGSPSAPQVLQVRTCAPHGVSGDPPGSTARRRTAAKSTGRLWANALMPS